MKERSIRTRPSIGTLAAWHSFFEFNTCDDQKLQALLCAAATWCWAFDEKLSPRWVTFLGSVGIGKTLLANKLWQHSKQRFNWNEMRYQAVGVYWPDFLEDLRQGDSYARRDDMKRWPVLFLDDIGAERDKSGFAAEALNTLLGCRMGRWTIITSNLTLERVAEVDQRIASRMIRDQNIVVQCETTDYALRKGWKDEQAD